MICRTLLAFAVLTSTLLGQTYTWTGGGVADTRWSNPANWSGGIVPVSSTNSTIILPASISSELPYESNNDLIAIDVGTLKLQGGALGGSTLRVHHRVESALFPEWWTNLTPIIDVAGDVTFESAHPVSAPGSGGGTARRVGSLSGSGKATFHGAWQAFNFGFAGDVHIASDGSLAGYAQSPQSLRSLTADGLVDLIGSFALPPGAAADLSTGALDLARADNTLGFGSGATVSFTSDVKLGRFAVAGFGPGVDRLEVSGTLDLTAASLVPQNGSEGWYGWRGQPGVDYVTIATYGNRVGHFAVDEFIALLQPPSFSTLHVVYTSAENAGPGEIRVLLPEPSILVTVAAAGLLVRRRREQ